MMTDRDLWWKAMWTMHDMCMGYLDRRQAFVKLRKLGLDRRSAAELIHDHEKEG